MIWNNFLLDQTLEPAEVQEWLVGVFSIPESSIEVTEGPSFELFPDDVVVVCEIGSVQGDFIMELEVHTLFGKFASVESEPAIRDLCMSRACRALISDDSVNPYRMVLLSPDGHRSIIHLDVDALDEQDRYVIASTESS